MRRESYAIHDAQGNASSRATSITVEAHRRRGRAGSVSPLHAEGNLRAAARGGRHARSVSAHRSRRTVRRQRRRDICNTIDSVLILACGTSYYSGLVAKQWIETLARHSVHVEIASEYRYRDSVPNPHALVVVVSQSGETADTLAALKHAQVARPRAHARHLQRRDELDGAPDRARVPDARRHRNRRRVDQGVHDAARCAVPAGADAREAARPPDRRARKRTGCAALRHLPAAIAGGAGARAAGDGVGAGVRAKSSTRCSSAAACTIRSRSKARSS